MSDELPVAAIRQCKVCGMVSAIELDATPENVQKMVKATPKGREVRIVDSSYALALWDNKRGRCNCK